MNTDSRTASPEIVWIYSGSLHNDLDAATWLETTRYLREVGCRVTLIHVGPQELEAVQGVEVVSIPMPNVYFVRQAIFHLRALQEIVARRRTLDIVLFHNRSLIWLLPWRYLRALARRSKPLFIKDTRTAPMIPKGVATNKDRVRSLYDDSMDRVANTISDGQTAITLRMAELYNVPNDQLLGVWPSGVDVETFAGARQKRDWHAANQNIHIIYIGATHYQRNLMNFCRAVELANRKQSRFTFTIVGGGTEFDDLKEFAENTDGRIRVLSSIPHDRVPGLLAQAHIGVLPFPDQERFRVSSPIKLFEYMASGMPILATHIACHTDVVDDGGFAFWAYDESVDGLQAALEEVWEQRAMLEQKGGEAAAAAPDWSWTASAQKLHQALLRGLVRSDNKNLQTGLLGEGT